MGQFFTGSVALIGLLVADVAAAQHLPPAPPIPAMSASAAPDSRKAFAAISLRPPLAATPEVLHVSPQGSDDGDGSPAHPFHTLERAQMAVRRLNATHDVIVMLADGTYRLTTPLHFTALDGGQHSHVVRWQASEGAHPVVSGGVAVTGWTVADRARDIWVATVPRGLDPRQLYVGTRLAQRAHVQAPRTAFAFTTTGITIVDPKWHFLASLPDQSRIEVEQTGFFTDRRASVDRISGETL